MMRVKGLTGPQADSVHRIRGLMAPQVAGRRSQVAMDSAAAARRQVHMDDIASGTPRLMEKAVAHGSWFVARKPPPLDKNGLWLNFTAGCPATAVRFGNRPAPPISRHLTGQKAWDSPYAQGLCHVFLLSPVNDIPFIACMRFRRG